MLYLSLQVFHYNAHYLQKTAFGKLNLKLIQCLSYFLRCTKAQLENNHLRQRALKQFLTAKICYCSEALLLRCLQGSCHVIHESSLNMIKLLLSSIIWLIRPAFESQDLCKKCEYILNIAVPAVMMLMIIIMIIMTCLEVAGCNFALKGQHQRFFS